MSQILIQNQEKVENPQRMERKKVLLLVEKKPDYMLLLVLVASFLLLLLLCRDFAMFHRLLVLFCPFETNNFFR